MKRANKNDNQQKTSLKLLKYIDFLEYYDDKTLLNINKLINIPTKYGALTSLKWCRENGSPDNVCNLATTWARCPG